MRGILATELLGLATLAVKNDPNSLNGVLSVLEKHDWSIFKRMTLQLVDAFSSMDASSAKWLESADKL